MIQLLKIVHYDIKSNNNQDDQGNKQMYSMNNTLDFKQKVLKLKFG